MSRIPHALAAIAFAALSLGSEAATSGTTTLSPAGSVLAIDGAASDYVLSWEGGDLRGTVVLGSSSSGGLPTKSLGKSTVAPLILQIALPPSPQLAALINELCSGHAAPHTLVITNYNSSGAPADALEVSGASLSEVTFPALDAASSAVGAMKLVFSGTGSGEAKPISTRPAARKPATTFRLSIDGLDGSGVQRIESILVTRYGGSGAIGEVRDYRAAPGAVTSSNLEVTVAMSRAGSWKTWWTDFVANGKASDVNEKRGVLELLDAGLAPLAPAFEFKQLGILRFSRPAGSSGAATSAETELYFEGLALNSAPPPPPPPPPPTTTGDSGGTSRPPLDERTPLVKDPGTSVSDSTILNAADQGSRDPALFPRVEGLTRTYYAGTFQPTYTNEQANYISTETIAQVVARVDAAAKAAGWTMTTLEGSGLAGQKTVAEGWTRPEATASVSLSELPDAAGTKLSLQVYVRLTSN